ncbi:cobaltochelatase subunit CobN [Desulfobulbus rhabdoformis]|uniref:cobaltochelatase subunit CobN n=1 Tax=Desulfobulbus rhabdoformis TaxID=34032 RepID=UPI0019667786|nr:cobaltochelatase subunit CobN [Desulfobulbus rhabdoformis]MBM9616145.1 cobaltochelatase subunit CobN [Desulfobulbus rhabdoformis]
MQSLSLCYFSATASEIPSLSEGVRQALDQGQPLTIHARTQVQLFDQSRHQAFVKEALQADVVIISLHGGRGSFPAFDLLEEQLVGISDQKRPLIHVQPTSGDEDSIEAARQFSTEFGTPQWDEIKKYLQYGGAQNFYQLLTHLRHRLCGGQPVAHPPQPLPDDGIYHPDLSGFPSQEEYLSSRIDPSKITVGLWFYQTYWINNNLAFIDALIRSIEAAGANVIPVFHLRYKDVERGNRGADDVVADYFMDGDKPRIDVLINPLMFSLTLASPAFKELLTTLGVPVIQAMTCTAPYAQWSESVQGMPTMDVSFSAAQPEFDGALITVPVATREQEALDPITGALLAKYMPIKERVDKVVRLALNWGRLSRIPVEERKIAIVFHHYPPRNDRIGCAAGLDSFASVSSLLACMQEQGYRIDHDFPEKDELAHSLLEKMTCDQRWLPMDQMAARAEASAGAEQYQGWHAELPEAIREKMSEDWGAMPGDLFVHGEKLHFAGLLNGNVFLTIQPPRGYLEQIDKVLHDLYLSPPHHYLAQYRWIRDVFKADAVMHVGKHGSLEWLPGKALGLSEECYPDLSIMELPNIYPYIINDPGEGTQAKRRSYCCIIDHLTPAFTNADLYDDLAKVQNKVAEYAIATSEDPGKLDILRPMIWEAVVAASLDQDLEITKESAFADFDGFLEKLHAYVEELGDTMINDGLHTMGLAPEDERLVEFVVQLTRIANGSVPSLRESLVAAMGCDYDDVLENRGKRESRFGNRTGGEVLRAAHNKALELVHRLAAFDFKPAAVTDLCGEMLADIPADARLLIQSTLNYIAGTLVPNIRLCSEELDAALAACAGRFVRPGPSGAPSRGQADILPTGRNFYSVDPNKIPSPAAWEVGVCLGDALIKRYLDETGKYPNSIGILIYGTATMRSRGDDLAEVLYLMGLKPVWQKGSGNVSGLEVIPASKLGRPRLDVVPRVSGMFRDSFPNLMELIDKAAQMVAALDEPMESNFVRRNVYRDLEEYRQEGMSEEEAWREATFRVFGCPPGTYGAGVTELIESKHWETQDDLGNNYIRYSSHAYGKGSYGKSKPMAYRRQLARMDVTVKNEDSREYDMMSCTDYYNYYGGMIVAVKTVRGTLPFAVMGDSSDPKRVKIRTTNEEAKHVLRSRLVNPKWIKGMKRHGYKGAGDISHVMDIVLGWDATGEVIDDWMYEKIAQTYALDPEMQEWMKEVNPFALQNILDKLLEAISRGMWQAESEMEEDLKNAYLEMEGEVEEWSE